jgi:hypothetical protein
MRKKKRKISVVKLVLKPLSFYRTNRERKQTEKYYGSSFHIHFMVTG